MTPSFLFAAAAAVFSIGITASAALLPSSQVATLSKYMQFSAAVCACVVAIQPSSKSIIVIFRGSSTPGDWAKNLDFGLDAATWIQASWAAPRNLGSRLTGARLAIPSGLKVHGGFQDVYLGVRTTVQNTIADLLAQNPGFSVYFTGHSLGGALASLAAIDYLDLHGTSNAANTFLYTYGQPRTGNDVWANWVSTLPFGSISRVTKKNDPVPHLPPESFSYRHFKQEYGINASGQSVSCTNTGDAGEVSDCMNDNFEWWKFDVNAHTNGYYFPS
nr:hypothetical protein HK105_002470 [Polyrhizophydium stewartii]